MSFKTPLDHQVIVTSFTCKKGGGKRGGGVKGGGRIKKGGDLKRGAPLHVVEGSRVFWGTGPKISSSTHRVEELVPQNPYFPTTNNTFLSPLPVKYNYQLR